MCLYRQSILMIDVAVNTLYLLLCFLFLKPELRLVVILNI